MPSRHVLIAVVVTCGVGTVVAACGSDEESEPVLHRVLTADLHGAAEVSNGARGGSGRAVIRLSPRQGKACWTLTVEGVDKPLSAHVHRAPSGREGPVVVPLGDRYASRGCVQVPSKALEAVALRPERYYVNVHTRKHLNGAVRGQLRPRADAS